MTFKEMIFNGLSDGTVKIISSPNDDCIACQIGEHWFNFIGSEDGDLTPNEVYKSYTKEELTDLIYSALQDIEQNEWFLDKVLYCKTFLEEKYGDVTERDNSYMGWHYMYEKPPKKPRFYQVAVKTSVPREKYRKYYSAICFWDGNKWRIEVDYYSLRVDIIGGAIGKGDIIYAWSDVLLPIPKADGIN